MGDEMTGGRTIPGIGAWLVDIVSRLLDPDEREVVRGDLIESGSTNGQALCDVLGLIIRRQARLWAEWKPWLALAGIVLPLGLLLSRVSNVWADGSAVYAWLYVNNWTWGFLEIPGARRDLLHTSTRFLLNSITLVGWSWTAGFVLGSLSRRTSWVNLSLFCLAVFGGALGSDTVASRNAFNSPVFSQAFYSVLWPIILQTLLIVLPALMGLRKAHRRATLPLRHAVVWAVAVALLTARSVILNWGLLLPVRGHLGLFSLAIMWPLGYMVATAARRRSRERTAPA